MMEQPSEVCSLGGPASPHASSVTQFCSPLHLCTVTDGAAGTSAHPCGRTLEVQTMFRHVLLVLSDAVEDMVVRRSLANSRDGPFAVEWVGGCGDAIKRLGRQGGVAIGVVVV